MMNRDKQGGSRYDTFLKFWQGERERQTEKEREKEKERHERRDKRHIQVNTWGEDGNRAFPPFLSNLSSRSPTSITFLSNVAQLIATQCSLILGKVVYLSRSLLQMSQCYKLEILRAFHVVETHSQPPDRISGFPPKRRAATLPVELSG